MQNIFSLVRSGRAFLVALLALGLSQAQAQCTDLFFSEYLEGSSNNKAIEIYNPTSSTVNLANYVIYRYNNGSSTPSDSLHMVGTLASGAVYVAGNPTAITAITSVSDTLHTITFYNGDDAMTLKNKITGVVLDIIGIVGNDPGTNWVVGTGATSEYTLVRMQGVQGGTTNWTTSVAQWDVYPQNTTTYIGNHSMIPCGASNPIVGLSLSASTGSEAAATVITVTATASAAVSGAQTVDLAVTGVASADYTLSSSTITIADGATTGSVTLTIVDDALLEGEENATLTISNPSAGILIGSAVQGLLIEDNDNTLVITEVHSTGSSNTTYGKDWFEVTNTGSTAVNITGWKVDDSSNSSAAAVALADVTSIAAGQSVVFMEGTSTDYPAFTAAWFGANIPAGFTIGSYTGSGIGLGSSFDAVYLFNDLGNRVVGVTFGAATAGVTFDNAANSPITLSQLSVVGVNGAINSVTGGEIGSPGTISNPTPTVSLLVSANAGSEAGTTAITVTADANMPVVGSQTVDLAVTGTGITAGDYSLGNTTITIASGDTAGSVTFSIVDDSDVEGTETAVLTISNPSSGLVLGMPASQNIDITDNDAPVVTLSVSTTTASEAAATAVTVFAVSNVNMISPQSLTLNIAGTGITSGDYQIKSTALSIPAGQDSAMVTLYITDDATPEGAETMDLSLSGTGVTFANPMVSVSIQNNDCSFIHKVGGITSTNGAEIPAFDPMSDKLFVVAGSVVEQYSMDNTGALTLIGTLTPGFTPASGVTALPNSVTVKNGVVAAAWAMVDDATGAQQKGVVSFHNATTGTFIDTVHVGYLPDMITYTPDGTKLMTANEGEPNSYGQPDSFDPEGSVSIIDMSNGAANATVTHATFTAFNSFATALKAAGVRIYGPGATLAQDVEPEYIAFDATGDTALVTLQENNAVAVVDIATATVLGIAPLGLKDYNLAGNGIDASDRDVNGTSSGGGKINIQNWPVYGMYQPDAIAGFSIGGQSYFITANEGDAREYDGLEEEARVSSSILDFAAYPNGTDLKLAQNLGRLQVTNATGDLDGDGDLDQIHSFGARSFTIWDGQGNKVFDSGDQLEQITAARTPLLFNSEGNMSEFDGRSDNKGPEPEGVAVGVINGRTYAFVGMERVGDIMVYDVTNPAAPMFIQYINTPEDVSTEGLTFVAAENSPTGKPLVITAQEVSLTVAVFEVQIPEIIVAETSGIANDGIVCPGTAATLYATPGASYTWSNGATSDSIVVTAPGTYTVDVTSATGCVRQAAFMVSNTTGIAATATATANACKEGATGTVVSNVTLGTATSYLWSNGASTDSIGGLSAGTYTVTVTDADGCTAMAMATVVNTDSIPAANATGAITGSGEVTFSNLSSANATSYSWSFGNDSTSASMAPVYTYIANGKYTVTLVATNNCGSDTFSFEVNITNVGLDGGLNNMVSLYPNPTEGAFSLTFTTALTNAVVEVYGMDGKLVVAQSLGTVTAETRAISLDRNTIAAGMYTVRVAAAEGVAVKRLIVR